MLDLTVKPEGGKVMGEWAKPNPQMVVEDYRAIDVMDIPQLLALGKVVAEFGIFEYMIRANCMRILEQCSYGVLGRPTFNVMAGHPNMSPFLDMMLNLIPPLLMNFPVTPFDMKSRTPFKDVHDKFVLEITKAKEITDERNDLLHASWGDIDRMRGWFKFEPSDPQLGTVSKRGGKKVRFFEGSTEFIETLAEDIAKCRHELNRTFAALPPMVGMYKPLDS